MTREEAKAAFLELIEAFIDDNDIPEFPTSPGETSASELRAMAETSWHKESILTDVERGRKTP